MKNIFRIFAAVFAGVVLFASCLNEAAPLASSVSVDKAELNPVGIGAVPSVVKVTADGDWFAVSSSEWITVEPAKGVSGTTEVTIKVADNVDSYNELNGPRSGSVSFCYGTSGVAAVAVNQKGENGLDASRTYSLVTKAEDLTAGGYIITFKTEDGKYIAMSPLAANYGYIYCDELPDPKEGVITMPNAKYSYEFAASAVTEGAFTVKMSNGKYIYMDGTYNSFSTTESARTDNSGDFTLAMFETESDTPSEAAAEEVADPFVKITSVAKDKYVQYSTSYSSVGAYPSAQEGALLPVLFKDAKPVSDEVLEVPESMMVFNTATSATIEVTSNKTWKVRNHDEWIKTFTANGEGNGTIEITFDALPVGAEPRTAEFLVIGETTNFTVTLTQKVPSCIADIYPQIVNKGDAFMVDLEEPAVVTYVNGGNAFIEDKTGGILYFNYNHGLSVGQTISGVVEGAGEVYSGLTEITSITNQPTIEAGDAPEYPVVTLADILDNYDRYMSCVVKIEGVKVTDAFSNSDRNGKFTQGGKNIALFVKDTKANPAINVTADSEGTITGVIGINNSTKQMTFWEAAHFEATKVVSAISMPATLSMNVDDVKALGATTNSTETITYVSSDPAVATVDAEGKVTALKVGETTITASVAAAGVCTAAEATCKVTVSEKPAGEPANDGASAATAFTIAEAKAYYDAGGDSKAKLWVKGVIIGSMVNNELLEGATGASNTNMVIGTADSYLPVALPSGGVRDALNLKDNPANINKEVAVYGTIEKYFKVAGVKNVTEYELK